MSKRDLEIDLFSSKRDLLTLAYVAGGVAECVGEDGPGIPARTQGRERKARARTCSESRGGGARSCGGGGKGTGKGEEEGASRN